MEVLLSGLSHARARRTELDERARAQRGTALAVSAAQQEADEEKDLHGLGEVPSGAVTRTGAVDGARGSIELYPMCKDPPINRVFAPEAPPN